MGKKPEVQNEFGLDVVSVRLVKDAPIFSEHPFTSPTEAVAVLGELMSEFDREVVCVINLRSDLKPINVHFASIGALNEAMAHPRELLKASILSNAASIMLVHSHPTGNLTPSKADTMMTDRMNSVCEMMSFESSSAKTCPFDTLSPSLTFTLVTCPDDCGLTSIF